MYAGGIIGSYCVNCSVSQCYSTGTISDYAGGIIGFGAGYIYDGSTYSPSTINNQNGDEINNSPIYNNNYATLTTTTCTACYSNGSINSYAGGIFGYFAYSASATNCYTIGFGTILSGGIFAPNYYLASSIYTPSTTNCIISACYTIGLNLAGHGLFALTGLTNNVYNSKAELNGKWSDCSANNYLRGIGCVWIDINKCSSHVPYLLASFNRSLYTCPYKKIKHAHSCSSSGLLGPNYKIFKIGKYKKCSGISINCNSGVLHFDKVKKGTYNISIINGIKTAFSNGCSANYYIWTKYNINNFILKSKYKKKCKSSSSSSSSSC
jgi:hypothetical protein